MIEFLKNLTVIICSAVILLTIADMLLPDNGMKKYCKFVLGLVFVICIIDGVFELCKKDINIGKYLGENISIYTEQESKKINYEEESIKVFKENFKKSLEGNIKSLMKDKFKKEECKVSAKVDYSEKYNNYYIKEIEIYMKSNAVQKVKKVNLKERQSEGKIELEDSESKNIKDVLMRELKVSKDIIKIYKE